MRISTLSKLSLVLAAAFVLSSATAAQAQWYINSGNTKVSNVGEISPGKLTPSVTRYMGLNFSTIGLFGDAEPFFVPEGPNPYTFPWPRFSEAGYDFDGVSYDGYLDVLAKSYDLVDGEDYRDWFIAQNPFTMGTGSPLLYGYQDLGQVADTYNYFLALSPSNALQLTKSYYPEYESVVDANELFKTLSDVAFDRVHEPDFAAGGGFVTLDPPTIPDPIEDEPFEPFPTEAAAASGSGSGSEAANVAVVPEPATLGLLALGAGAVLSRRR